MSESAAIGPNGLAESVVRIKDGSEAERQYRARPETNAYDPGVLENVFLLEFGFAPVVFADDDCKVTTGVAEDRGSIDALNAFQQEGAPGAGSIGEGLVLGNAVSVPRHMRSLRTFEVLDFSAQVSVYSWLTTFLLPRKKGRFCDEIERSNSPTSDRHLTAK